MECAPSLGEDRGISGLLHDLNHDRPRFSACALAGSGLSQIFGQTVSLSLCTSWSWKGPWEDVLAGTGP